MMVKVAHVENILKMMTNYTQNHPAPNVNICDQPRGTPPTGTSLISWCSSVMRDMSRFSPWPKRLGRCPRNGARWKRQKANRKAWKAQKTQDIFKKIVVSRCFFWFGLTNEAKWNQTETNIGQDTKSPPNILRSSSWRASLVKTTCPPSSEGRRSILDMASPFFCLMARISELPNKKKHQILISIEVLMRSSLSSPSWKLKNDLPQANKGNHPC